MPRCKTRSRCSGLRLGKTKAAKPRVVTESKRYRDFIRGRDVGLERVLSKYLARIDAVVRTLRLRSHEVASHIGTQYHGAHFAKRNREDFERRLEPFFEMAAVQVAALTMAMRRTVYMLTYVGQAEGLGRAWGGPTLCNLSLDELNQVITREAPSGGELHARMTLAFHRLLRDVVDAFQYSQVLESPVDEVLSRIDRAFPSKRALPKRMAKLTESAKDRDKPEMVDEDGKPIVVGVDMGDGFSHFVTQQEWDEAVSDYMADNIPQGRGPYDSVFDVTASGDDTFRYQWEVESEVTDDFVASVRSGDVDAANENGITDFVWISVLDKRTCEDCCVPRDGMLTSEIEAALKSGELDKEACAAKVPPAHMKCRCRIAAATDDLPEKSPPDFGSWDDFLEQKGQASA